MTQAWLSDVFVVVGDASDFAKAAYTPYSAVLPQDGHVLFQEYTPQEWAVVLEHGGSSTVRELFTLRLLVDHMAQCPHLYRGTPQTIQYCTDSWALTGCITSEFSGYPHLCEVVKYVHTRAWQLGRRLDVVWRPRTHPQQQVADRLSKMEDAQDWSVLPEGVFFVCQIFGCGLPTVDPFAAVSTAVARIFYTRHFCMGAAGVDGLTHPWPSGPGELVWVFPPPTMMPHALRKIADDRPEAVVVGPDWKRGAWPALFARLPLVGDKLHIPRHFVAPGPTFPGSRQFNPPPLYAWHVRWA